ncbi:MAG: hypothetical protein BWY99_01533 [Synergistetes bacterium ADurb.BinA166]|nr:MAG: hypothetical protein BWY99_01533 [Synergistetes bacterium ADurb.BinA166]
MIKPSRVASMLRQIADRLDQSRTPSKSLVAADLRRVIASVDPAPVEEALYGQSGPLSEDEDGSSIWWSAFRELGMHDWTPLSDPAAVEAKAKELLDNSQAWAGDPKRDQYIAKQVKSVRDNWNTYQQHYMPEHVEILKSKGLM